MMSFVRLNTDQWIGIWMIICGFVSLGLLASGAKRLRYSWPISIAFICAAAIIIALGIYRL